MWISYLTVHAIWFSWHFFPWQDFVDEGSRVLICIPDYSLYVTTGWCQTFCELVATHRYTRSRSSKIRMVLEQFDRNWNMTCNRELSMMNFLNQTIVSWLSERKSLFVGGTCLNIYKWKIIKSATCVWFNKKLLLCVCTCIHAKRGHRHKCGQMLKTQGEECLFLYCFSFFVGLQLFKRKNWKWVF